MCHCSMLVSLRANGITPSVHCCKLNFCTIFSVHCIFPRMRFTHVCGQNMKYLVQKYEIGTHPHVYRPLVLIRMALVPSLRASSCKHSSTKQRRRYFLNGPLLSLPGPRSPCLPPCAALLCPFINSVSKHNQVQLLLGIRWTGFPSETSSRPKGCVYLPSILAGLHHSLFVPVHFQCQVLTDASSFPLFSASHFSAFFFPPCLYYYYLPRAGTL